LVASRPDVFDALIARQPSADVMSVADLNRALTVIKLGCASDAEVLRCVQRFTRKHQFLIGARAVLGWMPIDKAETTFSKLAAGRRASLGGFAERKFQRRHGRLPAANGPWSRWGSSADAS